MSEKTIGLLIGLLMSGILFLTYSPVSIPLNPSSPPSQVITPTEPNAVPPLVISQEEFGKETEDDSGAEDREEYDNESPIPPPLPPSPPTQSQTITRSPFYTKSDLLLHNNQGDCWMAISGKVYDVTKFVSLHPGGATMLQGCGIDATILFTQKQGTGHSPTAWDMLSPYYIGEFQVP